MENILHDFNEKVISLVANCLKNSITEKGISDFTNCICQVKIDPFYKSILTPLR